jgi:hypothetical protein
MIHMAKHERDWMELGIRRHQLCEIAQAATQIGYLMGVAKGSKERNPRPVFSLIFYNVSITVAVVIGSNGFVVTMFPMSGKNSKR